MAPSDTPPEEPSLGHVVVEYLLDCAGQVLVQHRRRCSPSHPEADVSHPCEQPAGWTKQAIIDAFDTLAQKAEAMTGQQLRDAVVARLQTAHASEQQTARYYTEELRVAAQQQRVEQARDLASKILPSETVAARVQRYESHLSRQLRHTLDELERCQTRRSQSR